jgi:hypothetical protein
VSYQLQLKCAFKYEVAPQFLEFIGAMDARCVGQVVFMFNIEDDCHPRYRSTVAVAISVEEFDKRLKE